MKQLFAFVILVFMLQNVWAQHPASNLIETSTKNVLTALSTDSANTEEILKTHVVPHFDFRLMSKWVLGKKKWKKASTEQQERFIHAFQFLLIRTYQTALKEAAGKKFKIRYLPVRARLGAKRIKVKSQIIQGNQKTPIDFNMYQNKTGDWKVYNIYIAGISLLLNYRNEFKRTDIEIAITKLNTKNQEG